MFKVKRRIRSIRDLKKQTRANGELAVDQSSVLSTQRGILKSDNSCRSSLSLNSLSIWASNSSPSASAAEEGQPHHHGAGSRSAGSTDRDGSVRPRRVNFDSVRVREYERKLGDNPSCSSGAPITLGWAHGKERKININEYESVRQSRRNQRELTLSRMAREELLLEWGATFNEIIDAIRTNVKIKHQRRRTVNSIGTYDKLEEAMERAGRKIKKTLLAQKGSGSNKNGKNTSDQKFAQASSSDSPVSSISSEPAAGNTTAVVNASDDSSQTTIRRAKIEDGKRSENTAENSEVDEQATSAVPVMVSRESFSSTRPTPLIEIRTAPSCASAMSMLEDDFDEDGYDDFEDLLDPYITDEGDRMYPPEIHILNGHGHSEHDAETLTGSYAGYSMHSAEGFETLTRDHSHWKVESGSTNSGPKVKPVFNPITIYEDGPDDSGRFQIPPNYQSVEQWRRAGFQVQPPPHSPSLISRWD